MPRTDTASRVIAATPPDRVYVALVDPEALTVWLPPTGMTGRFRAIRRASRGSYRLVLTYADASASPGKATVDSDIVESRFGLGGLSSGATGTAGFQSDIAVLAQVPASFVLAGYALGLLLIGASLLKRRDVTG